MFLFKLTGLMIIFIIYNKYYRTYNIYKENSIYNSIIIVLTVWKRNNLLMQLRLIKNQTILKWMTVSIIIFQNANHINITSEATEWIINNTNIW